MPVYVLVPTLVVVLLLGWVAGMWTRKRSDHWCPIDGSRLRCIECSGIAHRLLELQDRQP